MMIFTHAIPLTMITGFLGAGKTTLLNYILHAPHGLKVAVLVNDFGAVNIDARLIASVEDDTIINLTNGCICCTIRDDLLTTVLALLQRPEQPEYIIIEASGIADPALIAQTFRLPSLRSTVRLDSIIAVIDAEHVLEQRQSIPTIDQQIAVADTVILNKLDLVTSAQQTAIIEWLGEFVPRTRVLPAVQSQVPLDLLLGVGRYDLNQLNQHTPQHPTTWASWHYSNTQPFDMTLLQRAFETLPTGIFRAKGIVYLIENPERQAIAQLVGKRITLILAEAWGDQTPQSDIVLIGQPDAIDPAFLQDVFDACLADDAEIADEVLTTAEWRKKYS